jgi:YesN/AraC family two-component response regulator
MKNLLIVDDENLLVENLSFILRPYASKIYTAGNGKEGLQVLESEEIHCVICDITMPVMNGVEFIKEARNKGYEVPFIFYSAYGNNELMLEVSKYGAFDFLSKPDFKDLETIVNRGLTEGFNRKNQSERHEEDLISDYQLLLEKLQNQKGN